MDRWKPWVEQATNEEDIPSLEAIHRAHREVA
jgi:hypothetical protein